MRASPSEITIDCTALRLHLVQCAKVPGWLHHVRCAVEAFNTFFVPRFVTTVLVTALLIVVSVTLLS